MVTRCLSSVSLRQRQETVTGAILTLVTQPGHTHREETLEMIVQGVMKKWKTYERNREKPDILM